MSHQNHHTFYNQHALKITSEMTPNSIRNHRRQHKCNWVVANGTRNRTGMNVKNDNHNNILCITITCLLKGYDQCIGECDTPLLKDWSLVMMLEKVILRVSMPASIDYDAVLYMLHDSNVVSLRAA